MKRISNRTVAAGALALGGLLGTGPWASAQTAGYPTYPSSPSNAGGMPAASRPTYPTYPSSSSVSGLPSPTMPRATYPAATNAPGAGSAAGAYSAPGATQGLPNATYPAAYNPAGPNGAAAGGYGISPATYYNPAGPTAPGMSPGYGVRPASTTGAAGYGPGMTPGAAPGGMAGAVGALPGAPGSDPNAPDGTKAKDKDKSYWGKPGPAKKPSMWQRFMTWIDKRDSGEDEEVNPYRFRDPSTGSSFLPSGYKPWLMKGGQQQPQQGTGTQN
jgi:hypothetical protein